MLRTYYFIVFFLFLFSSLFAESHLMRYADASQNHIVFTYESDLWLVSIDGGNAQRITRDEGGEVFAKFSPDGKKLAFTASYDGGTDVYVMDIQGSAPIRLTYHPAQDLVLDWFPDGKSILFRSRREYPYRADMLYKISIDGGLPQKLPVDRAGLASLSPKADQIAYNRNSREFRNWKRHQGGTAQDIWVGSLAKKDYQKITSFVGTDNYPMWHGNAIYFSSDREDGTMNLYKYQMDSQQIERLTPYKDFDVKYPSLGTNHIVYQYKETTHLLNLTDGTIQKVDIEIPSDQTIARDNFIKNSRFVGGFGLSPKGNRVVMDIRGEIVNLPVDDGINYQLTNASASREKNPIWSPDGKWIAFFSDKTGEEELYLIDTRGTGKWQQVTKNGNQFRTNPAWSPDSKHIIFHDKSMRLNLVDIKTGAVSIIAQSDYDDAWERWGIQDYVWSPDSKWIAFSMMEQSMYESIFLYNLNSKKTFRVTENMTQDWSPSFSADGQYLYFLSNRTFNPIMGFVDQNHIFLEMAKPYLLILKEGDPSPFAHKNNFDESDDAEAVDRSENIEITTKNFAKRIIPVPEKSGNLFRLEAVKGGFVYLKKTENEFLKYQIIRDASTEKNLDLYKFDLDKSKSKSLISGISQFHLSADRKKLIYKSGSKYGVVELGTAKVGDGSLAINDIQIKINKQEEFHQIFDEAWRVQRDWFYDKNMHGVNWQKVKDMYRPFVQFCGTRGDLNYLIGEMIAELNIGHTYIYGGDRKNSTRISSGLLGADFSVKKNSYPRIERIIPTDNSDAGKISPLFQPGCPIQKGDYIIAIDGQEITPGDNIYKYLQNKSGKVIELTFNSSSSKNGAKTHLIKTLRSERNLRYGEWVTNNWNYVDAQTQHSVGYVHLPGMMENGLIEFAKAFYPQYYKAGMIIDARYNGGGFTSKQIHDRLERTINAMMQPREGKPTPVPERTFAGHLVLLINRDTGSDGELFSEAWKERKLGPIIGQRTWGGAVGIEPHQHLVDGATTTPPQFGEYNIHKEWVIEGHGVVPDIVVINMPKDVLAGKDTQLDKAIEVVLDRIKNQPKPVFNRPAYPDKSKATLK